MKSYRASDEPCFSSSISIVEPTDPAHADNINAAPKQLLENTVSNRNEITELKKESLPKTGDSAKNTVEFESNDSENATSWTDVSVMESKETHKSLFEKVSTMFKNVRFLYKILGSEDISQIVDGTVTGILHELKQVALTGSYDDLDDTPNELPASDVYSWAKQATKPSYNKTDVGLGAVNNTSDLDKPVSTAQQTELGKKVNIASILESIEQVDANTTAKNIVDALVIKALKANLMNSINQINSNLTGTNAKLNAYTDGASMPNVGNANEAPQGWSKQSNASSNGVNFPPGVYGCFLLTVKENNEWGGQLLFSRDGNNRLFIRAINNGTWTDWTEK